ncbi:hypothetical protein ZHAS_00016509 [Anopheles sinensis]|uniref:Uncharacterized protein n=1 Tax=Anopheles sinensis TaxID=74873 RepID=A0A084WDU3_ANOSI|nr:hypothetical protein ZHAS_00016509 [Anopheles sinensis]
MTKVCTGRSGSLTGRDKDWICVDKREESQECGAIERPNGIKIGSAKEVDEKKTPPIAYSIDQATEICSGSS